MTTNRFGSQRQPLFQDKSYARLLIAFAAVVIVIVTALLTLLCGSSFAEESSLPANPQEHSPILLLLADYGDTTNLSKEAIACLNTPMEPVVVETDDVQVTLREIVYDGIWLYTAADIASLSEDVLVMPGAAEITSPCCGVNGEKVSTDERSFKDAALEDQKRLLAVYVYPKEFDELGEYFTDYRQMSITASTCLSGACVNGGNAETALTWSVQVYEVDLTDGRYTLLSALESKAQQVLPLMPVETREYVPAEENATFDSVLVMKTGIATYVQPMLDGEPIMVYALEGYTKDGEAISNAASPDIRAFSLAHFPEAFMLKVNDEDCYQLSCITSQVK